jgi:hypothetical protein
MPGIEFNQGIPEDIDNADYLDVSQRNLIVLDDLMAQSGKEKRIADLFTKGTIIEICPLSLLSKTYFIRTKKCEISALMLIISCFSSHQEINSKFLCFICQ